MKALVIENKNEPLVVRSFDYPTPGPGQAVVAVRAAALNHRDLWIQLGQYAGLKYPIIPGSDGAGVVASVGPQGGVPAGADERGDDWVGREVIINPAFHWGENMGFQHPADFRILGLPENGTLAEFVRVPISSLVLKPAHLSFEEAAAIPLAGVTAFRATMTRGQLRAGDRVLITGIGGGVALFAFQYALAAGARVYVTSGNEDKLARAVSLGAAGGVNYKEPDWVKQLKDQAGEFDVIIDGAAGDGMNDLFDLATPGGRVVFYGATRGNPSGLVARRIFWKQLNVLGSTMGSPLDFRNMIDFISAHSLRPIVDSVFSFNDGEAAFRHMQDERQFGKIVVKIV